MESGKGKCSYDPKLNSVSALISEYHLASGYKHGPALPLAHCMAAGFFFLFLFVDAFFAKCFMEHMYLLYAKTAWTSKPNHCILPTDI